MGTADGQIDGLQVLGLGELWPIYLEEMKECYILEPLVIRGLSHRVNLGISFLMQHRLKLICTEEEVSLIKDGSALRAQLVDVGCQNLLSKRMGRVLKRY